jgi:hypothetical protein
MTAPSERDRALCRRYREPTERGFAVSKIHSPHARASNLERWSASRLLGLAARTLLSALQESRERATRKIIRDYRHLLPEQPGTNSFRECLNGKARESQDNLKRFPRV